MLVYTTAYALPPIEPVTLSEITATSGFADSDAEIIKKSTRVEVDENFHETLTSYVAIKINSSNAISDYSQLTISYDSFYEEGELIFANTIDEKGNRQALDPKALQVQTPPSPYFFQDKRNIVFSVPSLKQGTVIEYQFQRKTKKLRIENYWGSNYYFYFWQPLPDTGSYRVDPVRHSDYYVSVPKSLDTQLRHFNGSDQYKVKKTSKNGINTYRFKAKDLPTIEVQHGMPSIQEFIPYISLSTLDDWSVIKSWASDLFQKERLVNDEVKKIASRIKAKHTTEQGLIRGVYEYLNNNIRYVYSHVGRGGYTPHQPSHTLDQGFGDCKDQTMLAVVLLNELGIEAHAALVNTEISIRFSPDRYNPSFDHMLVYMPQQPIGYRWMDTTADKTLYPGSLGYMSDRYALILSDDPSVTFVKGAKQLGAENALNMEISFDSVKNQTLVGKIKLSPTGSFEAYYRSLVSQYTDAEERQFFLSLLTSIYSSAELVSTEIENSDDLFAPINIVLNFEIDKAWEQAPKPLSFSLSYQSIWRQLILPNAMSRPQDRKVPLYANTHYGMNIRFKSSVPEDNYYYKTVSASIDHENEYFKIDNTLNATDTDVEVYIQGEFYQKWVDVIEYDNYFKIYDDWLKSSYWLMSFTQDENRKQESALLLESEESIDATNKLIQLHLDQGHFEKALSAANEAIKRADATGHTYHLLGLSQAYNDDADASEASFKKAQELGYE